MLLKQKIKIFFIILVLLPFSVFADFISFDTLPAENITNHEALLRGMLSLHFDHTSEVFPELWFEYGTKLSHLDQKTPPTPAVPGDYVFSQIVDSLQPGKTYYYRTALSFQGDEVKGTIKSFTTKKEEKLGSQNVQKQGNNEAYRKLEEMLNAYDHSVQTKTQKTTNTYVSDGSNGSTGVSSPFSSFSNFWHWLWGTKEGDSKKSKEGNTQLVHSPKEGTQIKNKDGKDHLVQGSLQKNEKKQANFEKNKEAKVSQKSATKDDEWGEVVSYHYNPGYHNPYDRKAGIYSSARVGTGPNYTKLFFTILFLALIFFILRFFYYEYHKHKFFRRTTGIHSGISPVGNGMAPTHQSPEQQKYYIPVDPKLKYQNDRGKNVSEQKNFSEKKTFFRKPPLKK